MTSPSSFIGTVAGPERIAAVGWFMTALGAAVAIGVFVILALALWRGAPQRAESAVSETSVRWLVGGGLVLPIVVISVVFGVSLAAMSEETLVRDPVVVEVTGHQFWWEIVYPGRKVVTANEIHVPVDVPVELRLTSDDVIHSFWVPELGGKMDALPDRVNTLVIQADAPGRHDGVCAEFCGIAHAHMGLSVVAQPVDAFDDWVRRQSTDASRPATAEARAGADVFSRAECGRCHTVRGTDAAGDDGPDLTHVASRERLAAGRFENEPGALRAWLIDPHEIKPGVEMPAADLAPDRVEDLIAYLESLE